MNVRNDEPATKKDLDQVKQVLTDKIDANSAKIDANSAKIDQVEQRLTAKIDANSAKLDRMGLQITENSDELSKMLTREEYKKGYNELLRGQDEMMVILTRLDDERVATTAWIRRVEDDVDTNKCDIKRIKTKLAMDA
jgi:acyl-CoA reductase-like NAD-dependent aldehyde dehydrogenase